MSNLNDAKVKAVKITLSDGVEREVRFTLNALAELEDRYGSVEAAFTALENNSMKAVRFVLWASLMHSDESLTEKQVGNLIDVNNMGELMKSLNEALENDTPNKTDPNGPKPVVQLIQ